MTYFRLALTGMLVTLLALSLPVPAAACSCVTRSLCELFSPGSNAIVFEATVESIEARELPPTVGRDIPAELRRVKAVHLKDVKNLLGEGESLLLAVGEGTSCEVRFTVGRRYVIHASRGMGFLTTGGCSRTSPIERAADLLAYIEGLSRPSPGAKMTGSVRTEVGYAFGPSAEALKPLGVKVHLTGPVTRTVPVRDEDGTFSFDLLPPGSYGLEVTSEGPWVRQHAFAYAFTLANAHACHTATIDLRLDSSIRGSVIDAAGRPVEGAEVNLRRASAVREAQQSPAPQFVLYERATSDELGSYVFEGVPPGEFVVGLNISSGPSEDSPYNAAFVVAADGQPEVITHPLGGHRLLPPIVAAPARYVEVTGRVLWPDGRPGAGMRVRAFARGEAPSQLGIGLDGATDADGRFVMKLPAGIAHNVRAFVDPDRAKTRDDYGIEAVAEIVAGTGEVTLVLTRPR